MHRILLFFVCILIEMGAMHAQLSNYSFHQISTEEGLSQSSVQTILVDSKGRLWIGTMSGLNMYAQQQLKIFYHQPEDKTSLPHNRIFHLTEDSLGTLWVSTANGLSTYHPDKDEFSLVSRNVAYSSIELEGGILFGSDNLLLFYDYKEKNLKRIYIADEKTVKHPISFRVVSLKKGEEKQLWVATRQEGVYVFDTERMEFIRKVEVNGRMLTAMLPASDGCLYTAHYGAGILRYSLEGKKLRHFLTDNSNLSNNYVMDLTEHEGRIWAATDGGGINLLSFHGDDITTLQQVPGDASSLPDNSIVRLYKDREGELWAGSVREGIFSIRKGCIHVYKDVPMGTPFGLTKKTVSHWCQEKDGSVWLGTDGGGINHFSPHTGRFTHFPKTFGDKVSCLTHFSEKELLVTVYTKGIFLFNKQTNDYLPFVIVNDSINRKECHSGYLPMSHRINKDKIYILSYHPWVYSVSKKNFHPIRPVHADLRNEGLRLAYANDSIALLYRNNQAYLCQIDKDTYDLCFETEEEEGILTMTMDKEQRIWTGTNQGLGYYDLKEKQFHRLNTELFHAVSFLTVDNENQLWVCAQNMLFTYDIEQQRFTVWSASDGYEPNEVLSSFQRTLHPNYLYMGGTKGLIYIRPDEISIQNDTPTIYHEGWKVNGKAYQQEEGEEKICIPWDYHSFSAAVQVKTRDVFQKNLIRYFIRKGNTERSFETYETEINLPTLSPGKYSLWASCNRKDGSFIDPVKLGDIVITPPWYLSTWFLTLVGLVVMVSIGCLFHYLLRQRQKTVQQKIEDYKEWMTEEKVNFLTNMQQELSTPQDTDLSERDREFMEKFNELVRNNLAIEDINVEFLTNRLAMSRASLYQKVKQLTGLGVNDYINRLRIEQAVDLLIHTDKAINDIASEVGFTYPRYFSTLFKKIKGVTPSQFKESQTSK